MSSTKKTESRAADRRAQAMKMNYTKVRPTVVKHVLPNEVMSIYDKKVSLSLNPHLHLEISAH
jgi:hypothetical protein